MRERCYRPARRLALVHCGQAKRVRGLLSRRPRQPHRSRPVASRQNTAKAAEPDNVPRPQRVKPDRLVLIDRKTEPLYVLLGEAARKLPDDLAVSGKGVALLVLDQARDMAAIVADARLHDLRHAHATQS